MRAVILHSIRFKDFDRLSKALRHYLFLPASQAAPDTPGTACLTRVSPDAHFAQRGEKAVPAYPFTAPAVTPEIMYFWQKR